MNTRKNKRKYKSRRTSRRRRINRTRTRTRTRTKKLKGGGWTNTLNYFLRCYKATTLVEHCINSSSIIETAISIPESIKKLETCAEIAQILLHFYDRTNFDAIDSKVKLDDNTYYLKLKTRFGVCIEKLKENIDFLLQHDIITELGGLSDDDKSKPSGDDESKLQEPSPLLQMIKSVVSSIRGKEFANAGRKTVITIWADWYRSRIEGNIAELTALLTQFNLFGQLQLMDRSAAAAKAAAKAKAAAAAPAAAPAAANTMTFITPQSVNVKGSINHGTDIETKDK